MKKTSGFTLVELIVVIAILGILAGIAIPVYSGYIQKANEAADLQQLDAIKTAAIFAAVDKNPSNVVAKIDVIPPASGNTAWTVKAYTASVNNETTTYVEIEDLNVATYLGNSVPAMKSNKFVTNGATWLNDEWGARTGS